MKVRIYYMNPKTPKGNRIRGIGYAINGKIMWPHWERSVIALFKIKFNNYGDVASTQTICDESLSSCLSGLENED
jgi:hypothetical protein